MYAKVFTQIYDGTLCTKGPWEALVTFQQMLVLADMDGNVDMTAGAIARRTTIPLEIIEKGIGVLLEPDPESRTPTEQGRRIVPLVSDRSWGWRIVNYKHYRALKREEDRREYHRDYWHKRNSTQTTQQHSTDSTKSTEAEAEADTKKTKTARKRAPAAPAVTIEILVADGLTEGIANDWLSHRRRKKANLTATAWNGIKAQARKANYSISQAVEMAIRRGWTSFEAEWVEKDLGSRPNGAAAETQEYLATLKAHKAERPPPEILEKLRGVVK
jgi:hypothetical protein